MNNIENLAIEQLALNHGTWNRHHSFCFTLSQLEAFAKAYADKNETYLLSVIGDIRQAMGNSDKLMLDELAPAIAKAYQAQESEAVAWVVPTGHGVGFTSDKPEYEHPAIKPLFAYPPDSQARIAELEATNKTLLDALRYYADKNNWSRDSQELGMEVRYYNVMYGDMYEHNDVTKYGGMRAKQAIADAEGVDDVRTVQG